MKQKGSFTVEAALMVPFIIVITMICIYMTVYAYDKALLIQDTNSLVVVARDDRIGSISDTAEKLKKQFEVIKSEHPYLSVENLEMKVYTTKGGEYISLSCDWKLPIQKEFNRTMICTRKIYKADPISNMFLFENINDVMEEIENDFSND